MAEWFHFVWDRTRGIRKDITQQELCCLGSVTLVEQCARFHIHCSARLIAEDNSVFDEKINTENLTKCLQTLKYMYHDLPLSNSQVTCANEPEFRAYVVLLNLNDANFMWEVQQLPVRIQQSSEIKFAIEVYSALDKNNYVKFFKLVRSTTYLNACILLRYFNQVRYRALRIIVKSYSPRQPYTTFPIAELSHLLAFEDEQNTMAFVEYYGLQLTKENTHVLLDRRMFHSPDVPFSLERAINVVESKRTTSVGEVICGHSLPEKTFLQHVPYDSFDENGRLKLSEVGKEWQPKYAEYLQQLPSDTQQGQSNPADLLADDMDVELDSYSEETREIEKTSAEFRFSTPNLISSNVSREQLNLNIPNFKFTAPTELTASDSQDISEPDNAVICTTSQENLIPEDKATFASPVKPFWLNAAKPATSVFGTNQNIFGNTAQNSQPAVIENTNVFNTFNNEIVENTNTKPPAAAGFSFLFGQKVPTHTEDRKLPSMLPPNQSVAKPDTSAPNAPFSCAPIVQQNEPDSDEEERMLREQLLKAKRESEQRELARKAEEQRKIEQLKLKERLRQETLAREKKLKLEVGNLLKEMLVQVDQLVRTERLNRLERSVKKHRLAECFNQWRDVTRIARKKRKCFFDNPVWIPSKSIQVMAQELYTENQELTLNNMKRYKRGIAQQPVVHEPVQIHAVDMCQTVWRTLFETLCGRDGLLQLNVYWKVGISLPESVEDKCSSWYVKQTSKAFQLDANLSTVRQFAINNGGCFTYNVKHITGLENGLNGLMFFVNEFSTVTHTRLARLIDRSHAIPVVVITNTNKREDLTTLQLQLSDLRNQEAITDYTVIYSSMNQLQHALVDGLKWLASKVEKPLDLEMDALATYLHNGIGEEFWHRIRSAANINQHFGILLTDPNITINLHNEAVRHLMNITVNPEISTQQNFPAEFKEFVEQTQIILPCSYEYFPDHWKSTSFVQSMNAKMETLILPTYNYPWPSKDHFEFQKSLQHYCARIFGADDSNVFLIVISLVFQRYGCEQLQHVCWPDIIQIIVLQKLKRMSFIDASNTLATVVYKKSDLKQYFQVPWWYKLKFISDNLIRVIQMEQVSEPEVTDTETETASDIDKLLADVTSKCLDDDNEDTLRAKQQMNTLTSSLKDLEESMEIQKKTMDLFQQISVKQFRSNRTFELPK